MAETSKWTDSERRYRLALTVVELSRGWQMRYPLDFRRHELQKSLAARIKQDPLPPLDAFTLRACAAENYSPSRQQFGDGLPPEAAHFVEALTCLSSYFDAILDSKPVVLNPIPEWVGDNQKFTERLAREAGTSPQKRKRVWDRFLADLLQEVAEAALESEISHVETAAWLASYSAEDIRAMPSLGLFNEVYTDKHLNQRTVWHSNDLTDMMYLTYGTGYADYVVAERSAVSFARQAARRLNRSIKIYSHLSELLVELDTADL
jgi:hypothetical protein